MINSGAPFVIVKIYLINSGIFMGGEGTVIGDYDECVRINLEYAFGSLYRKISTID